MTVVTVAEVTVAVVTTGICPDRKLLHLRGLPLLGAPGAPSGSPFRVNVRLTQFILRQSALLGWPLFNRGTCHQGIRSSCESQRRRRKGRGVRLVRRRGGQGGRKGRETGNQDPWKQDGEPVPRWGPRYPVRKKLGRRLFTEAGA